MTRQVEQIKLETERKKKLKELKMEKGKVFRKRTKKENIEREIQRKWKVKNRKIKLHDKPRIKHSPFK